MTTCDARSTPEAYHEFIATVDRVSKETSKLRSHVAGWLYTGLVLAAQGAEEVNDSAASTINGP